MIPDISVKLKKIITFCLPLLLGGDLSLLTTVSISACYTFSFRIYFPFSGNFFFMKIHPPFSKFTTFNVL